MSRLTIIWRQPVMSSLTLDEVTDQLSSIRGSGSSLYLCRLYPTYTVDAYNGRGNSFLSTFRP